MRFTEKIVSVPVHDFRAEYQRSLDDGLRMLREKGERELVQAMFGDVTVTEPREPSTLTVADIERFRDQLTAAEAQDRLTNNARELLP